MVLKIFKMIATSGFPTAAQDSAGP